LSSGQLADFVQVFLEGSKKIMGADQGQKQSEGEEPPLWIRIWLDVKLAVNSIYRDRAGLLDHYLFSFTILSARKPTDLSVGGIAASV
jgi:hypothetical protein